MGQFTLLGLTATALLAIPLSINFLSAHATEQSTKNKPALSTVYGRVIYDDSEQPVRRVTVVLCNLTNLGPDPARWQRWEAQLFCTTDAQGKCTVVGAPLEYLIFILPHGVQSATLEKTRSRNVPLQPDVYRCDQRSAELLRLCCVARSKITH